jgi:hypothetical protein
MDWATKRQFGYLSLVIIAILFVVFFLIYHFFLSAEPTCNDGKQNGLETGVDCGGTCSILCTADLQPLHINWVRHTHITDGVYNALAYVENFNANAGIASIGYKFTLKDQNNQVVGEVSGRTRIDPQKNNPIFIPRIETTGEPKHVFFEWTDEPVWRPMVMSYSPTDIVVEDVVFDRLETTPRMKGVVVNRTQEPIEDITVIAHIYDRTNTLLAASQTRISYIDFGESYPVVFTWPRPFDKDVYRHKIDLRIAPNGN